ncbi:hypothetical protein ACSSZE_11760 [Acidithiobacillus caldus]
MGNTNYEVAASDCFIHVLADTAERAMEIAQKADPKAEILGARRMLEDDHYVHYVVIGGNILGFLWGGTGKAGVLRSKDQTVPEACGPILTMGRSFRPATVQDFREFRVCVQGCPLIYSASEAAINAGAGFWNSQLGFTDLEGAQVFSDDELLINNRPKSTGDDARFFRAGAFL